MPVESVDTLSLLPEPFPMLVGPTKSREDSTTTTTTAQGSRFPQALLAASPNRSRGAQEQLEWFLLCSFTTRHPKPSFHSPLETVWDFARKLEIRAEAGPSPQDWPQDALRSSSGRAEGDLAGAPWPTRLEEARSSRSRKEEVRPWASPPSPGGHPAARGRWQHAPPARKAAATVWIISA